MTCVLGRRDRFALTLNGEGAGPPETMSTASKWVRTFRGMRALSYFGSCKVKVVKKPDPEIEHSNDAILEVTRSAISRG